MAGMAEALKASGCTADEEATAAKQFLADDIQDPGDLSDGDDEAKAGAKIDEILGKTNLSADAKAKIRKAMLAAFSAEKKTPPAAPPKLPSSTSVQAVLQGLVGVSEDEKVKVLAEFDKQGIIELADLGKDDQSADAKIDEILAKTGLSKDKSDLCKNALKAARTKESKPGAAKPAAPAESKTVPAGAVNVQSASFPTLKAEAAGTIATFKIPDIFTSGPDPNHPFQSLADLKPWQWIHLARTNNLTKALDLNLLLAGSEDPWARYPAFLWELGAGAVDDISKGTANSTVSASIEEDRANTNMVVNASVVGQYAFCSASVKASYAMQTNDDLYSKHIYTRARWRQPRCAVVMQNCLTVAPIFRHLIGVAFDEKSIKPEDRFDYLMQLLELFGHLVPQRVYLGGMLEIYQDLVSVEAQSLTTTKTSLDTAVGLKKEGLPASGQLQVGFALDGSGTKLEANCVQNLTFTTIGGDPTLVNPAQWLPTANAPERWKTIGRETAVPLTQWLKPDEQLAIDAVIARKAAEAWTEDAIVALAKADGGGFTVPLQQDKNGHVIYSAQQPILPFFPKGSRVTLKNWGGSEVPDGDYLKALNTESRVPDQGAGNEDGQGVGGQSLPPGHHLRVKGTYYSYCQPAPECAPDDAGANPEQAKLLWRFVYTGRMIRDGTRTFEEPLFWIVSDDQQWVLSSFYVPQYAAFACLFPYEEEKKQRTASSPAKWLLRLAVPPGRLQLPGQLDDRSGYFRLYNPYQHGYLADYATLGSWRKYTEVIPGHMGMGAPGAGGAVWIPDMNVDHKELGPDFRRTMVRVPADVTSVFGADGKPDTKKETGQQWSYKHQCWLIENRTDPPSRKTYAQLQNDYIQQWLKNHEAGLAEAEGGGQ